MLETVMQPDESIFFENKELLLKEEEDDHKVIPMRWFRFAVAAVVLIAFSVTGWIFFGERKSNPPMALNNKQMPVAVNKTAPEIRKPSENKEPAIASTRRGNTVAEPAELKSTKNYVRNFNSNFADDKKDRTPNASTVLNAEPVNAETTIAPQHVAVTRDIVASVPERETITVPVSAREMEQGEQQPEPNSPVYAQSFEQQDDNNDLIYFANTSLTKKTKLRGVLRKASRYLDRVTSLQ